MLTEVTATTTVEVPVRQVYDQWTQFESFPRFMSSVERVEQLDDERTRWDVEIGGARRSFEATITEQQPDSHIAWESLEEKVHRGIVRFEGVPGGTLVSLTMQWMPEGFVERVGAAMNVDERAVAADLARFKEFIEERHTATGAWRGTID